MSIHKDCGEDIRWARRDETSGKWLPPLEHVGFAYILLDMEEGDDKKAVEVPTYRVHQCDPEKMLAWREYKEKIAAIEEAAPRLVETVKSDWAIAREREREEVMLKTAAYACPRCNAPQGSPCTNLSKGKSFGKEKRWPHKERMELAE